MNTSRYFEKKVSDELFSSPDSFARGFHMEFRKRVLVSKVLWVLFYSKESISLFEVNKIFMNPWYDGLLNFLWRAARPHNVPIMALVGKRAFVSSSLSFKRANEASWLFLMWAFRKIRSVGLLYLLCHLVSTHPVCMIIQFILLRKRFLLQRICAASFISRVHRSQVLLSWYYHSGEVHQSLQSMKIKDTKPFSHRVTFQYAQFSR